MGPVPRKLPLKKTLLQSFVSSLRLAKNLILANLGYGLRTRPLKRRGALVLVDRYYYNYFLDPVSVKYYGPQWLLQKAQAWFPKPDLVVVLKASTQTLLARKQELSPEEAERQNQILENLRFNAKDVLELDAGRPPEELAGRILDKLTGLESSGTADSIAPGPAQI
jgi:thymidylate kinase